MICLVDGRFSVESNGGPLCFLDFGVHVFPQMTPRKPGEQDRTGGPRSPRAWAQVQCGSWSSWPGRPPEQHATFLLGARVDDNYHESQVVEVWMFLVCCLVGLVALRSKYLCHEVLGFLSSEYCALNWGSECHNLGVLQTGSPKANHLHELLCGIYLPSHPSGLSKS
ncbi:uncharacterized protein LOC123605856 isoform X3 [Leopardus geoffroyi]|uniref:uncharacterized protein LOC123605856 isoform X3 n=1 Tax=Leopardus geoffroyi TaxID=46844 RepID=UPI001E262536|nr:uncharacterized protein LOC123605856 isoform X3 [Leopardus geoffroyi]XP_045349478.1 uncharacterized protein LOC123605856 isoform X3 [Leopardus geoffroyi]XP_045349479.1 uncharacterized protein LOC123605856 isoform X3 [Leopardus geoffroyi]